jgi:hypothetical protein
MDKLVDRGGFRNGGGDLVSVRFLALLVGWFGSAVGWMSERMDGEC